MRSSANGAPNLLLAALRARSTAARNWESKQYFSLYSWYQGFLDLVGRAERGLHRAAHARLVAMLDRGLGLGAGRSAPSSRWSAASSAPRGASSFRRRRRTPRSRQDRCAGALPTCPRGRRSSASLVLARCGASGMPSVRSNCVRSRPTAMTRCSTLVVNRRARSRSWRKPES